VAQFRVEFVLDQATGKYFAELYHPERAEELLVRTKPLYATQEAAVLGVVHLFKGVIPQAPGKKAKKAGKKSAAKKAKRKQTGKRRK
jgi:hypothetical protein